MPAPPGQLERLETESVPAEPILSPRRPWLRGAVSLGLLLHLLAVVLAPLAVAPTSPLWLQAWSVFRPYLQALNLNHGYHFFAPEPGPGHLLRYELHFANGNVRRGIVPDATHHQPRLRYHRHFMLSEFLNRLAIDEQRPELFERVSQSYADHLCHAHGAERVTLTLRRHYIPGPQQVAAGMRLDDVSLFAERPVPTDGVERR